MTPPGSKHLFIRDRYGNETMRVQYDAEDGAIEFVKVYESASNEWVLVDSDNLPPITETLIEDEIAKEMGPLLNLANAGKVAR